MFFVCLQEFQGWTPATVLNLTTDQLDVLFVELNKYRESVPREAVTLQNIKIVLFKWLGVEPGKGKSKDADDDVMPSGLPAGTGSKDEIRAWAKAKYRPSWTQFLKQYRKDQRQMGDKQATNSDTKGKP